MASEVIEMFNDTLRALRQKRDMTQAEVARELFISQAAYSKYEVGTSSPNPETLARLADVLGVSVDYLVGNGAGPKRLGYIRIPVLSRVAAGIPIDAIEDIIDWEDISAAAAASRTWTAATSPSCWSAATSPSCWSTATTRQSKESKRPRRA